MGHDFRHKHIAYCLARGRAYEQIENKVKESNEPDWTAINHYLEKLKTAETELAESA